MRKLRAFTLVELILVVSILGIPAALVLPRFSGAADVARFNAAHTELHTLRTQIQAWQADHRSRYPTLADLQQGDSDWAVMMGKTDADGTLSPTGPFGPYIVTAPVNDFTNSSLVVEAGSPVETAGWTYDEDTGTLRLILPVGVDLVDQVELAPDDYERP